MKYNAPFGAANPDAPYINGNPSIGLAGSIPPAESIEFPQREIVKAIIDAGMVPANDDLGQLSKAIRQTSRKSWVPAKSLTITTPPPAENNTFGDTYVIPQGANGDWADKNGQLAEWNGQGWNFYQTPDGHGIGLPDGSIYIKIAGVYTLLTNLFDKRYAQLASPPASTFYVIGPTGNDNNTGLKPTPDEGFATVQGAVDAISAKYITPKKITIKISAGQYEGVVINASFVSQLALEGDVNDPGKVIISATKIDGKTLNGLTVSKNANVTARGITFSALFAGVCNDYGNITIEDCNVVMISDRSTGFACWGGKVQIYGNIKISGTGVYAFYNDTGGMFLGYNDGVKRLPLEVKYDNATCSGANFINRFCGHLYITASVVTFYGKITGRRFIADTNSTFDVAGAGEYYLPGTIDGQIDTGARYS